MQTHSHIPSPLPSSTYTTPAFPSNNIILWNRSTKLLQFQDKQKSSFLPVYFEEIFLRCSQIQGFVMSVVKSYLLQQSMQLFCPAFWNAHSFITNEYLLHTPPKTKTCTKTPPSSSISRRIRWWRAKFWNQNNVNSLEFDEFFLGVWPNNCAKVKNLYLCVKVSYYSLSLHKQRISFQFSLFLFFSLKRIL